MASDPDVITFSIPGNGAQVIVPASPLPAVSHPVQINGYSQPGTSLNTRKLGRGDNAELRIVLNGRKLASDFGLGLEFSAGSEGSAVRGLVINRFGTAITLHVPVTVAGNFIGTDVTGTRDRGNIGDGIFAGNYVSVAAATIGGADRGARNIISGNDASGITSGAPLTIQGNLIGVASDGHSPLGNSVSDIPATGRDAAVGLAIGRNTVGGPGDAANVIAFNEGKGVSVTNSGTIAQITRNRIFGNGRIAIDLGDDGRTPNDADDSDLGPNGLLNFPVLKRAIVRDAGTRIRGVYRSTPAVAPYGIELFASPPGSRQAKRFIGFVQIQTGADGGAKFAVLAKRVHPGDAITATATDDGAETSELSAPIRARRP